MIEEKIKQDKKGRILALREYLYKHSWAKNCSAIFYGKNEGYTTKSSIVRFMHSYLKENDVKVRNGHLHIKAPIK